MEPVEQVLLHVRPVAGFQAVDVIATTEYVRAADLMEIVGWFTTAETESFIRFDTLNIFFHPLPSGCYAIGIISPGEQGFFSFFQPPKSFFVRLLVVSPKTLLEKNNHPIALFNEFRTRRKIPVVYRTPKRLLPLFSLPQKECLPELIHWERLESLSRNPGPLAFASLFQSLFDSECTFFHSSTIPTLSILAALFDLLPVRYRTELTFSTELFFSSRSPFRAIGRSCSRRQVIQQAKLFGIPAVLMNKDSTAKDDFEKTTAFDPWSRFVYQILRNRDFALLESRLKAAQKVTNPLDENEPLNISWENLHHLAVSRSETFNDISASKSERASSTMVAFAPDDREALRCFAAVEQLLPMINRETETGNRQSLPLLQGTSTKILERLPRLQNGPVVELDSLVARSLFGDESALQKTRMIWKSIGSQIAWDEKDMIREEYLSLIRSFLVRSPEGDEIRPAQRSSQLLDLILIFLEK